MIAPKHILISRTDSIGDVVLTLPLCAKLKQLFPEAKLSFLGKTYTKAIIESYTAVDNFIDWSALETKSDTEIIEYFKLEKFDTVIHVFPNKRIGKLLKSAGVKNRIGTSHRLHHWLTCNIRPNFTRKKADLHEAQLNFKLAQPLGIQSVPTHEELIASTQFFKPQKTKLPTELQAFLKKDGKTVILHPKSQGSAIEWPIDKYIQLAEKLVQKGDKVIFTGTEKEGAQFREKIAKSDNIFDSTGLLSLEQLITLIGAADALVACSTGPLHIAAFSGIKAIGFFSPRRPIHPGRWQPIGEKATFLVFDSNCLQCAKGEHCHCIEKISINQVITELQ